MHTSSTHLIVGASSGIGRSLALTLARERKCVALVGRSEERLTRVAREVAMFGGEPLVLLSDVRDPVSIQAALAQITLRGQRIESAILSSGVGLSTEPEEFTSETLETMLATNVLGVAHWLEALQPLLKAQPGGATVGVISSLAADRAFPGEGAGYSASKAAVSQLCDGLRAPWAAQGIRLVTIAPGFIRTPMTSGIAGMPFLMEPEDAARVIWGGLRRGQSVVRFPLMASMFMAAVRLLPPGVLDRLYRVPLGQPGAGTDRDKPA
ncbi:MAG: SDR family NAD(P)-dependent oxidoreductase [Armatimonadota bacterium]|nr:SDR family NAD(P)-dependent oxidoreductase [Armatimonadota bacterium]